jgi:DNA-binding CsgD family transcriptional regulator
MTGGSNEVGLSPRQIECLRLAARGLTTPEMARSLGISARTVQQHVDDACSRLGVRNRVQAVARAMSLGFFLSDPP